MYLRVDGGYGVELRVVVERLGEPPDGRLLALPLQPAVQHPLAAPLQTPAALALDLTKIHSDHVGAVHTDAFEKASNHLVELCVREVKAVSDVPPSGAEAAAHPRDVILLQAPARQVAPADVLLLGLA